MGVIWKAIASTPTVHARHNALVTAPVYLFDGTKIADGFSDIWDHDIDSALVKDQFAAVRSTDVWTGSGPDGNEYSYGLGSSFGDSTFGRSGFTSLAWFSYAITTSASVNSFYALSGILTVPVATVPEASPFVVWLGVVSVLGLVGAYRRWTA